MFCALLIACACAAPPTEPPAEKPTDEQVKLLKTFREEFLPITPGEGKFPATFLMGRDGEGFKDQQPVREVKLAGPFEIARYEVPQNLWEAVTGKNPSKWKGARNSVEMLSWDEANAFCRQATLLMREARLIEPNQVVRLPTEAEWEYCARAGTKTVYSFGDDEQDLDAYGWHTGNAAGNDPPVGAKKPNAWGLYDVHGYLWEWCSDAWHPSYEGAPADSANWPAKNAKHGLLRGGSWKDKANRLTSSYRLKALRALQDDAVGLRCVLATEGK